MLIGIDGNEANISQRVGINQWAFELIKHLHQLETPHRFVIFLKSRPLPDMPPAKDNFSYEVFGPTKAWVLTGLTLRLFRQPKVDVLFSPSHYIPLFSLTKRVFSIMDLAYEQFTHEYFKEYDLQQLRRWTALSAKSAHQIITISQNSKSDIEKIYHVAPAKIAIVHPGYNDTIFHSRIPVTKIAQIRDKYQIKGKYFVFIGTLQPRKNIIRLIKAFAKLGTGTKLVVVGKKGWLYDDIFKLVTKLGIEKKVIFTGFAPTEDLPALLKGSVAYVLPSLYEGFGIPVVEAQACGAIAVISAVSSLPEVGANSVIYIQNPLKVGDIAEGLRAALSLPKAKREALIAAGRENVKRFSWHQAAQKTVDLLTAI